MGQFSGGLGSFGKSQGINARIMIYRESYTCGLGVTAARGLA